MRTDRRTDLKKQFCDRASKLLCCCTVFHNNLLCPPNSFSLVMASFTVYTMHGIRTATQHDDSAACIIIIRGQSIKKPNFFFNLLLYLQLIKLVSFEVLPSTLDTPRPFFFPVLERVLERVLRDGAKVPYRIFFYLLYRLKSATF